MKVLISGAGIGGIATALALLMEDIDVQVFEQANRIEEVGAGLQISANAVRVLEHLGVLSRFAAVAVAPEEIQFNELESGDPIYRVPLGAGAAQRYGRAFYQCHRADLLKILLDKLPAGVLTLDNRMSDFEQDENGVKLISSTGEVHRGDVLIAADGLHSMIRAKLFGEDKVRDSGLVAWRALIPHEKAQRLDIGHICAAWMGKRRAAVAYWVRPGALFNMVGIVPSSEVRAESWVTRGSIEELRTSFTGCNPVLQRVVESVDSAFLTGFYFRDSLKQFSAGRTALIGDAAHPMLPFLAQGAGQSLEDAVTIAHCLRAAGERGIPTALINYDRLRRPRTTRVQSTATMMGEQWTLEDPSQIRIRNGRYRGVTRIDPYGETIWGWLYGYDPLSGLKQLSDGPVSTTGVKLNRVMKRDVAQAVYEKCATCITPADIARGVPGLRDAYERLLAGFPVLPGTEVEAIDAGGVPCLRVRAPSSSLKIRTLHLHGGGFLVGSATGSVEYASRLSSAIGSSVLVVDYRLAPEHPYPAALDDAITAYEWLCQHEGARPVVSGESAGAGLAISLGLSLKGSSRSPIGYVLLSPFADMTVTGESVKRAEGRDPLANFDLLVLMSGSYLQGADPRAHLASPIFADLTGLAPMIIACAESEALRSDSERLHAAAMHAGVASRLRCFPDTTHIFGIFPSLPEAQELMGEIAAFCGALPTLGSESLRIF
jgi:salicylate hydroxylase